jgi:hypothetical protein
MPPPSPVSDGGHICSTARGTFTMTDIDLIGYRLPSEGIHRKHDQLTKIDHYLTATGGVR